MGMYTGIRFKGYVKEEFRNDFEDIAINGNWEESSILKFQEFGEIGRSGFVPCGALAYMPDEWEDSNEVATGGFERTYDVKTGYWTFQCSLKNYGCEIETFFELIPYFIETLDHLEYFYEEWTHSSNYELIDKDVVNVDREFV